jgi:S1-C subfamily serine protease
MRIVSDVMRREQRSARRTTRMAIGVAALAVAGSAAAVALVVTGAFEDDERTVAGAVDAIRSSTVLVISEVGGQRTGNGTGWVLDGPRGLIVTNAHVVNGGTTFKVEHDRKRQAATIVGSAPCEDLAVLRVANTAGLETLALGSQTGLREGETVVAVGYPGTASSRDELVATSGVVSAPRTRFDAEAVDVPRYRNVILTDAAINPGNSGGPLVDLDGRLVGVNSAGSTATQSQNYAIGVDRVRRITADLRRGRSLRWTGMGFQYTLLDSELAGANGLPTNVNGLVVDKAVARTPAARRGFGEFPALVIGVNGRETVTLEDYCQATRTGKDALFSVVSSGSTTVQRIRVGFG